MSFRKPIKVCFGDIDKTGIVYDARFMHYFHLAMEEFFPSELGIDYADVSHMRNLFPAPSTLIDVDFLRRLRYGVQINMEVRAIHIGRTFIALGV